jgi:hypothetical protein
MDLLYAEKYDAFAIISSDSDFTKLASRLRESEMYVFGVGERKTPVSFRNSCDDFIFSENLGEPIISGGQNEKPSASPTTSTEEIPQDIIDALLSGWIQYKEDDGEDWANVSAVGGLLKRLKPDFDPRTYGVTKIPDLILKIGFFEMTKFKGKGGVNIVACRPKNRT